MKKQKLNIVIVESIIFSLVISTMLNVNYIKANVTSTNITESWSLVWSDEFNGNIGSSPDEEIWNYDTGATGWGNNEIQNYKKSTENVYIADISQEKIQSDDNKALAIKLKKESDGSFTSGRIHTLKKQYFKYGRVEAKLKVENGSQLAVWPAFWMMGNNYNPSASNYDGSKGASPWPACGEIDIMEHRNREDVVIGTMHWNTSLTQYGRKYMGSERTGEYGNIGSIENWHTYALEWYENCLKWYVDGVCYQTLSIMDVQMDEFQRNMFLIFNVALGGPNTAFTKKQTVSETFTYATMYVDYVRIYQGRDEAFDIAKINGSHNEAVTIMPNDGNNDSGESFTTTAPSGYDVGFTNAMSIVDEKGNVISEAKVGDTIGFKLRYKNKGITATTGEETLGLLSITANSQLILQQIVKLELKGNGTVYQTYFWKVDNYYLGQNVNIVANFSGATKTGQINIIANDNFSTTEISTTEVKTIQEPTTVIPTTAASTTQELTVTPTTVIPTAVSSTTQALTATSPTKQRKTQVSTTTSKFTEPGKTKVTSAKKKKTGNKVKIYLKKVKQVHGYQIHISGSPKFKKILVKKYVKKVKITITSKKLNKKKKLYIKARSYKLKNKKKYYSKWSKVKKIH